MNFSEVVLPLFVVSVVLAGVIRKINVFDCFIQGAEKGLGTVVKLIPVLSALMLAVTVFTKSGAVNFVTKSLSGIFGFFGIPEDVIPLCLLSPVSGSGSLSVYEDILVRCGPDSYAGRVASVIAGATETTFYAVSVYLGASGIKKSGAVIPCALLGDIVSFICAALTVKYMC